MASAAALLDVAAATAVLDAVANGWLPDQLGALAGEPWLVIDLDTPGRTDLLRRPGPLPFVVIGVSQRTTPPPAPEACDVLLTSLADPPRPWVGCPGGIPEALAVLGAGILAAPAAGCTLVQLLRVSESVSVPSALVAESLAYSALQSGPEFAQWLGGRSPRRRPPETGEPVVAERHYEALTITLSRPQVRNAFNAAMRDALTSALELAGADPTITQIEVRGAGPSFCSGGDLDEFGTLPDPATAHLIRTTRSVGALLARLATRTTAYLHGSCVGAGIELPAFANRVVAEPDSRIMLPEVAMGLVPGAGGTASIPRRTGRQRCAWLALSGQWIDAPTAAHWGLIDEIRAPN
jgi:enoyl-CoA hydratase/carnithine racemase